MRRDIAGNNCAESLGRADIVPAGQLISALIGRGGGIAPDVAVELGECGVQL